MSKTGRFSRQILNEEYIFLPKPFQMSELSLGNQKLLKILSTDQKSFPLRLLIFPVAVSTISISDCSVNTCSHLSRASFGIQNGRYLEPISYNKFQLSEVNQTASPCFTIFLLNWIPEAILSVNFPAKIINQMVLFRNSVTKVLLNLFVTLDPGADPIKKMSCWFRVL